nr:Uncharacterised protein [Klebsiella pneumoniae]
MDKVAVQVGEQRHQSDRAEGFQREGGAHPPDGEPVEGQINGEENHAERQVGGVVDQKGHARRPAGQGATAKEDNAKGDHQRAEQQRQGILQPCGSVFRERTLSINKHYLFVNKDKLLFAKIAPEERALASVCGKNSRGLA